MPETLKALLGTLDARIRAVSLDELVDLLAAISDDRLADQLKEQMCFAPEGYRRNLLHETPDYHALVLCWEPGQRSPIHDHAGSICGVRVIQGTATEIYFERSPHGCVFPTSSRRLSAGTVLGSQDADIHQIANLEPHPQRLVTLHIYSPPLHNMGNYSMTEGRIYQESVNSAGLLHGAGI